MSAVEVLSYETINADIVGFQAGSSAATLKDGGWVVSWMSNDLADAWSTADVMSQRYNADGTKYGGEVTVATGLEALVDSDVIGLQNGDWLVSWTEYNSFGAPEVCFRYCTADGSQPLAVMIDRITYVDGYKPQLTALADGGWLVVTTKSSATDPNYLDVFLNRFDSSGNLTSSNLRVNTVTEHHQFSPDVTALHNGGWIVAWESTSDMDGGDIKLQRYAANGNIIGGEVSVNTTTAGGQMEARTVAFQDGGFGVLWLDYSTQGPSNIFMQRFGASGAKDGGEIKINSITQFMPNELAASVMADGSIVVVWHSSSTSSDYSPGLYQRVISADGSFVGTEMRIDNGDVGQSAATPDIVALADGSWVVKYDGYDTNDGSGFDVVQRHFKIDDVIDPQPPVPPTLYGTSGDDVFTVTDTHTKFAGHTEGMDTVNSFVTFTLPNGVENLVLKGTAAINATGSSADNVLTGNGAANTLIGLDGDDRLNGGAGVDLLKGGKGNDIYYVDVSSDKAIDDTVNGGTDIVYSKASYTISATIEKLTLQGATNINATGNGLANALTGSDGKNTLSGLGGNDVLHGGAQSDKLYGGAGNDVLHGDTGNDILSGGADKDLFVFAAHFGKDEITDFTSGDRIDLRTIAIVEDFAWIKAHATEQNGDTIITIGTDKITLDDVSKDSLHAADFLV